MDMLFKNPPVECRPIPFWFWNGKLDGDEIERQIELMAEAGLGGFFMHARFGLETEYMSDEWLTMIKRAVKSAKKNGIRAWLYDEYPFPSGVGGLAVTAEPDHRNKFLDLFEHITDGGQSETVVLRKEGEHAPVLDVPVALAIPVDSPLSPDSIREHAINADIRNDEVTFDLPKGRWRLIVVALRVLDDPRGNVFGPDYLNPKMTESFLRILDRYRKAVGDEFGETVPGIFTDEPCLLTWHQNHTCYRVHHDGKLAVWSESLQDVLTERLGNTDFSLKDLILALFYDLGDAGRSLRQIYRHEVANLYVDSFFQPYARWCSENNLKLTGHLLLEEGLYSNTIFQGDFMRDLGYFDIPGTDHLGVGCEGKYGGWGNLPEMSTNVQGQKLVSSAAHVMGKKVVLSESFGVGGWRMSPADMKRIVDWQFSLGINLLCPHAFYYSLEGFRKTDSPPSQFFQTPYWRYYRLFADSVARLSYLMQKGRHVAQIALVNPIEDFWRCFKAGSQTPTDRRISDAFNLYCQEIPKCHYDLDIVPERMITEISVADGNLKIADETYEAVIVPPVDEINPETTAALVRFYESGGSIILSENTEELMLALQAVAEAKGTLHTLPANVSSVEMKAWLRRVLPEAADRTIDVLSADGGTRAETIRYIQRRDEEKDVFFLVNTEESPMETEISIHATGKLEQWDIETGEIAGVSCDRRGESISFPWLFEPYESVVFVLSRSSDEPVTAEKVVVKQKQLELIETITGEWDFRIEQPNVLPLNEWRMSTSVSGDWTVYEYSAEFNADFVPDSLLLMLDDIEFRGSFMEGASVKIEVNGASVDGMGFSHHIDPKWKTIQIAPFVRRGENRIGLRYDHQSWAGEPKPLTYPPKLLGSFALSRRGEEWVMRAPREKMRSGVSWVDEGYPFYSGSAVYRRWIDMPQGTESIVIEAEEVADTAEFIVNGETVATRLWRPFVARVDVGDEEEILLEIRVTNSMANMIESDPKPSGLIGHVRVWGVS